MSGFTAFYLIVIILWAIIGICLYIQWDIDDQHAPLGKTLVVAFALGGPIVFVISFFSKIMLIIDIKGIPQKINEWLTK